MAKRKASNHARPRSGKEKAAQLKEKVRINPKDRACAVQARKGSGDKPKSHGKGNRFLF